MATASQPKFENVPVDYVFPSTTNPRKHFAERGMADLTESIRTKGIIQPIVVRFKDGAKGHEIVAGERRWRAAKAAGLATVPVIIKELTDDQALEIQVIENLQREDVHPLEEAQGYMELLKRRGYDVPAIAIKVGKDESYIYKRLKFADLIEPAREAFLKDEINASHALILARLPEDAQKDGLKEIFQVVQEWDEDRKKQIKLPVVISPSQLQAWVQTEVYRDLSKVHFSKSDETLLPKAGGCTYCTKRTGAQMELIEGSQKGDFCLDDACFHQKQNAHLVQIQKTAKQSGRKLLTITKKWDGKADVRDQEAHVITKATDHCEAEEEALWVDGSLMGKTNFICRDKACKTHKSRGIYGTAAEVKTFADVWKEKRARLDEKINLETQQEIWRQIIVGVPEEFERADMITVGRRLIDRAGHDCRRLLCGALKLEPEKRKQYGTTHTDFEGALNGHFEALEDRQIPGFLVGLTLLSYNSFHEPNLLEMAHSHDIVAEEVKQGIAAPLVGDFEKKKAKAKAAHDKKKVEEKKAAKAAAKPTGKKKAAKPVKDAKRGADEDVDENAHLDDDPEGEE